MREEDLWAKIERLKGAIEALGQMSEEDVTQVLQDNGIDAVRRDAVIGFREEGFTAAHSQGALIRSLVDMQEIIRWYQDQAALPQADRASISVQIAESEYIAAQSETELAARCKEPWHEICRALLAEEIFRLQCEIAREQ